MADPIEYDEQADALGRTDDEAAVEPARNQINATSVTVDGTDGDGKPTHTPLDEVLAASSGSGEQFTPAATTVAGFDAQSAPKTYPSGTVGATVLAANDAATARTAIAAAGTNATVLADLATDADAAAIVTAFNTLLGALRAAGLTKES